VADVLRLAAVGAASLHGAKRVQAEAPHRFDHRRRRCRIAAGTAVGDDLNRLFVGFATQALGPDAVRLDSPAPADDRHDDGEEAYRTVEDWADALGWGADELADVLAADPGLHLGTPLTANELDDRLGLALRRIKTDGGPG
jgi:hypothetical protein